MMQRNESLRASLSPPSLHLPCQLDVLEDLAGVHLQSDGAPHTDWTVPEGGGMCFLYLLHRHEEAGQALSPKASLSWTEGIDCLGLEPSISGSVCHMQIVLFM